MEFQPHLQSFDVRRLMVFAVLFGNLLVCQFIIGLTEIRRGALLREIFACYALGT